MTIVIQTAIDENERNMRALGIDSEDELQNAMQSLRGKPVVRMIGELVACVARLEKRLGVGVNDV
jgi:hypothetical protein